MEDTSAPVCILLPLSYLGAVRFIIQEIYFFLGLTTSKMVV